MFLFYYYYIMELEKIKDKLNKTEYDKFLNNALPNVKYLVKS